jgi:hypothetical protein
LQLQDAIVQRIPSKYRHESFQHGPLPLTKMVAISTRCAMVLLVWNMRLV